MTKELAKSISDATLNLLREGGNGSYFGEHVTQLQHALQAADLARSSGAEQRLNRMDGASVLLSRAVSPYASMRPFEPASP